MPPVLEQRIWLIAILTASLAGLASCGDDGGSTCGPSNCAGCCSNGKCFEGDLASQCGTSGGACRKCAAGDTCSNGQCGAPACGPQSCGSGCCQSGVCQAGNQPTACGNGGTSCMQCPAGQTCDPTARTCIQAGACAPQTCPTGCCQSGVCQQGTTSAACGTGGGACNICSGPQSCDPASKICVAAGCTPQNCATGCCLTGQCFTDHAANHCGSGGVPCATCVAPQTCLASGATYACQASSGESYKVTLVSAVLSKKPDGSDWDGKTEGCVTCFVGCCPPDAYPDSGSVIAGMAVPKVTIDNTLNPTWNVMVGNATAAQLTNGAINITIKDSDAVPPDDAMGACTGTISAADLSAGQKIIASSNGCTGSVQSLTITFVRN